jgi:hypothetical protein
MERRRCVRLAPRCAYDARRASGCTACTPRARRARAFRPRCGRLRARRMGLGLHWLCARATTRLLALAPRCWAARSLAARLTRLHAPTTACAGARDAREAAAAVAGRSAARSRGVPDRRHHRGGHNADRHLTQHRGRQHGCARVRVLHAGARLATCGARHMRNWGWVCRPCARARRMCAQLRAPAWRGGGRRAARLRCVAAPFTGRAAPRAPRRAPCACSPPRRLGRCRFALRGACHPRRAAPRCPARRPSARAPPRARHITPPHRPLSSPSRAPPPPPPTQATTTTWTAPGWRTCSTWA